MPGWMLVVPAVTAAMPAQALSVRATAVTSHTTLAWTRDRRCKRLGCDADAGGTVACRRDALIIRGDMDGDADGGVESSFVGFIPGGNLAVDGAGSYFTALGFGANFEHAVLRLPLREDEPEVVWHSPNTGIFGTGMAVDGDIFVTGLSSVLRIDPKTGTHDILADLPTPCAATGGMAIDKDNVYVGTYACASTGPGVVAKVPRAGGGTATAISVVGHGDGHAGRRPGWLHLLQHRRWRPAPD